MHDLLPLALALGALLPPAPEDAGAPDLAAADLLDARGDVVGLPRPEDGELLVVAWTGVGCPIAGKYAPRLTRLAEEYGDRGVRFVGVNASPQDDRAAVEAERAALGLSFPVLLDHRQELTRALDVRTTTEVVLLDGELAVRYRGAVDDQYDLGAGRPAPTETWLVDALDAALAGRPVATERTDAPGCRITLLSDGDRPASPVTWSRDVAPILRQRCETCHRPGQVGPFALQTYEQARGWSEMILEVVEAGRMPPWNAHAEFDGRFANERRLDAGEKAVLAAWVAGGLQRGNPAHDPPPAAWPVGWRVGEPDAVFAMESHWRDGRALPAEGYAVAREGVVPYEYFAAKTDYPEDRWIQALEVRPGAADVVHHVLVLVDDPGAQGWERDRQLDFRSYLAAAVPGDTVQRFPDGYAKRLPKGATLVFQVHYTPNGKVRHDRSRVGFVFADEPPAYEVLTAAVVDQDFTIPAGNADFEVRAEQTFGFDLPILGFLPHMHTRGRDFRYVAHYPSGRSEELLGVDFDFNWQEGYHLRDPITLPTGTVLECVGHFDNSAANPNNPDPRADVRWGDQTFEEMFIGYYDTARRRR